MIRPRSPRSARAMPRLPPLPDRGPLRRGWRVGPASAGPCSGSAVGPGRLPPSEKMPSGLPSVVEHANDFDDVRLRHAIEDHMHRVRDRRLVAFAATVPDVKAAHTRPQLAAVGGRTPLRVFSNATHRGEEERRMGAGIAPMPFFARPQNRTDIAPGRLCKPVARHGGSGVGRIDEAIEPIFEVGIIDFLVVATLKVGEPGIDAPPQPLEL